jgi:hypothetical protein
MAVYTSPKLNLYGELNETFNSTDFTTDETSLTIGDADDRYFKKSGGTISGAVQFNNGLTSSSAITAPYFTFANGGISQTSGQLGEYKFFQSAITGGSINNGTASSPAFNNISLTSGVYLVSYYHNITCTASVAFSQIISGITANSSGVYNQQAMTQSSTVSETLSSGNKYISGTYVYRASGSVTLYAPITISFTTTGTISINLGINATRLA